MYVCELMNHSLKVFVYNHAVSERPKPKDPDFEPVRTDPKFGSEYSTKVPDFEPVRSDPKFGSEYTMKNSDQHIYIGSGFSNGINEYLLES
jgi:hypothetical protein